ncbi:DUF4124 domain-containing protein [Ramlibacter sp.]|uniref:DUF4124 domain-containing protein n=1 Tax=Ramlibacter sp. TaxID=1917967 RepID=UPI002D31024B|nr:DUF4124 domain-containing protein [Ramlibacter sp.]HYD75608.1 DUF4124 domain-containing protein [Ramlibacter sp.]
MIALRALALACICIVPLAASAQWQWIDKGGRRVFSDQAPPPDVPEKNILRRPGERARPAALAPQATASEPAAKTVAATAPTISGKDKALEEKKKQAEAAEAEKKKAQAEAIAKAQAENCGRAKQAKAQYDSGQRIARMNDKGEREIMDDDQRAAEVKRLQDVIARDCKPA